jgi:hypothetical protein
MNTERPGRRQFLWIAGGGCFAGLLGCSMSRRDQSLPQRVGNCEIDPGRLAPLKECMECCGAGRRSGDEWNHSCIHPGTVAYSCGRLAYPSGPNDHDHDPDEVLRCRRLADAAAAVCRGLTVNLSEGSSDLNPFFSAANRKDPVPDRLSEEVVRSAFGGTIYPQAAIDLEPLEEGNRGWTAIADSEDGELHLPPGGERNYTPDQLASIRKDVRARWEEHVARWRAVLRWFRDQEELHGGGFVLIGENPLSRTNFGCVFPRLLLGITKAGSLVGVCGHAVHS